MKDIEKSDESKSLDILGLKPFANSVEIVAKTVINDASDFLNIICRPAAEEFGLLLKDRVRSWRVKNLSGILMKTKKIYDRYNDTSLRVSPRIAYNILENGSWIDDDTVQEMWAGLLASSCIKDGNDDSNLIFINLLSQLTSSETMILDYISKNTKKMVTKKGLIFPQKLEIEVEILQKISKITEVYRLDRELDHLKTLGLITRNSGFMVSEEEIEQEKIEPAFQLGVEEILPKFHVTPTALALNLYVRCNGSVQSPIEYFGLKNDEKL